ncbi:protein of unknown function [Agreia sp. COWG]|nr:protein of unknown function [Agreia sp. COWG]
MHTECSPAEVRREGFVWFHPHMVPDAAARPRIPSTGDVPAASMSQ